MVPGVQPREEVSGHGSLSCNIDSGTTHPWRKLTVATNKNQLAHSGPFCSSAGFLVLGASGGTVRKFPYTRNFAINYWVGLI